MNPRKIAFFVFTLSILAMLPVQAATVQKMEAKEHHMLVEGENKHELTAAEVTKLKKDEARIKHEAKMDRLKHGGHLTRAEREKLKREIRLLEERIKKDERK